MCMHVHVCLRACVCVCVCVCECVVTGEIKLNALRLLSLM